MAGDDGAGSGGGARGRCVARPGGYRGEQFNVYLLCNVPDELSIKRGRYDAFDRLSTFSLFDWPR